MGEKKNNLVAKLYREIDKLKGERDAAQIETRNLLRVIQSMAMGWESSLSVKALQRQDEVVEAIAFPEPKETA